MCSNVKKNRKREISYSLSRLLQHEANPHFTFRVCSFRARVHITSAHAYSGTADSSTSRTRRVSEHCVRCLEFAGSCWQCGNGTWGEYYSEFVVVFYTNSTISLSIGTMWDTITCEYPNAFEQTGVISWRRHQGRYIWQFGFSCACRKATASDEWYIPYNCSSRKCPLSWYMQCLLMPSWAVNWIHVQIGL